MAAAQLITFGARPCQSIPHTRTRTIFVLPLLAHLTTSCADGCSVDDHSWRQPLPSHLPHQLHRHVGARSHGVGAEKDIQEQTKHRRGQAKTYKGNQKHTETNRIRQQQTSTGSNIQEQTITDKSRTQTGRNRQTHADMGRARQSQTGACNNRQGHAITYRKTHEQSKTNINKQKQAETGRNIQKRTSTNIIKQQQAKTDRDNHT